MPLPAGNQVWPPKALAPVTSQIMVWDAWYGSDLDTLSGIYGGDFAGNPARPAGLLNPLLTGWRAKVARTVARWFWGIQTPANEQRTKLHLPVARDIAATSADQLFAEPPSFKVDDDTTQKRLDQLTDKGMHATLTEAGEVAAGLGGVYLRVVWDDKIRDRPWLSAVHADAAIPEWQWDALTAVTFWREVEVDGMKVTRHLERHEKGQIFNGLYQGSATDLGKPIDLGANDATKNLKPVITTGVPKVTAVYVPNMRPAPSWRHEPAAVNLGRADFDGAEPFMDSLDEIYSSWMRDIRLGRGRVHIPASYLTNSGPGQGAHFEDREFYAPVNVLGGPDTGLQITNTQFLIRVEEHQRSALEWLNRIVATSGYSAQTFGLLGDGPAVTATEVDAKKTRSYSTRAKKVNYWSPELADITETLMLIDKAVFGTKGMVIDRPDVEFGDGVSEAPRVVAETLELLHRAESVTLDTKVRILHPDWDEDRVKAEVAGLRDESGLTADALAGGIGNPAPPAPPPPVPGQ